MLYLVDCMAELEKEEVGAKKFLPTVLIKIAGSPTSSSLLFFSLPPKIRL